ncbi:MAG: alpha/beta fold hydrolase [Promethearchaeia archaeon]
MIFDSSDGIKLHYKTYGSEEGSSILLLHGIGADHTMFSPQINFLTDAGYYVITPDMRAHGKSSKVDELELDDFTSDIDELVTHLGVDQFILLGVSMGGVIALHYLTQFSEKVTKIIICDSFGEINSIKEKLLGAFQVIGYKLFKYLPKKLTSSLFASPYKALSKDAENYFREISKEADYDLLVLTRKAINQIDVLDDLQDLDIPALILVGDQVDLMIDINKKIADNLKNATFRVIQDSLDPSNLVRPAKFNELLLDFLEPS